MFDGLPKELHGLPSAGSVHDNLFLAYDGCLCWPLAKTESANRQKASILIMSSAVTTQKIQQPANG